MNLKIINGYETIGNAENIDEAEKICKEYCCSGVSFQLKRKIKNTTSDGVTEWILIYQYSTGYLEIFFITPNFYL